MLNTFDDKIERVRMKENILEKIRYSFFDKTESVS